MEFEKYVGVCAYCAQTPSKHFSLPPIAVAIASRIRTTALLIGLSAVRTTLGLVGEPFASIEILLASAESERRAAVHTV